MHLIARGIGKLVYDLTMTSITNDRLFYYTETTDHTVILDNYPFYISKDKLTAIGNSISNSRQYIPTSFQGSFENIICRCDGVRAVDWLDYLLYIVPTIVVPCLSGDSCKKAVLSLVRGCALALQWELNEDDINALDRYML